MNSVISTKKKLCINQNLLKDDCDHTWLHSISCVSCSHQEVPIYIDILVNSTPSVLFSYSSCYQGSVHGQKDKWKQIFSFLCTLQIYVQITKRLVAQFRRRAQSIIFLPTTREGNVFTGVCHSVYNRPHAYSVTAHSCWLLGHLLPCSRYASYWNSFFLCLFYAL